MNPLIEQIHAIRLSVSFLDRTSRSLYSSLVAKPAWAPAMQEIFLARTELRLANKWLLWYEGFLAQKYEEVLSPLHENDPLPEFNTPFRMIDFIVRQADMLFEKLSEHKVEAYSSDPTAAKAVSNALDCLSRVKFFLNMALEDTRFDESDSEI